MYSSIQKIVNSFQKNEVIVFCGAGISFNSGIPVVWDIKTTILDTFNINEEEKLRILNYPQPFEAFMETLIERTNPLPLFKMFECGEPNNTHHFLAKMAKNKMLNIVVTTNFDQLIEMAMSNESVEYDLIYNDDNLLDINLNDERVKIIKLHGSIHDKSGMAITIKKVAANNSIFPRKKAIDTIFSNQKYKSIIVMGYSCSDIFDINPCISEHNNKSKYIYFIDHILNECSSSEIPSSRSLPAPFEKYSGVKLSYNTDAIVKYIWNDMFPDSCPIISCKKTPWNNAVAEWSIKAVKEKSIYISDFLAASLCKYSADFEASNKYLLKIIDSISKVKNQKLIIITYQSIGDNYRDTGNYPTALKFFHKAEILSKNLKMHEAQCLAANSIGIVYEDQKKHDDAIQKYQSALNIAKRFSLKMIEGKILGNIGIVFKNKGGKTNLEKAIKLQKKALQISNDTGDKRSEGRTLGNLAKVYNDLGDKDTAIKYYERAYEIALELADIFHQAVWQANMGVYYTGLDKKTAKKCLKQARGKFQNIGNHQYVKYCNEKLQAIKDV